MLSGGRLNWTILARSWVLQCGAPVLPVGCVCDVDDGSSNIKIVGIEADSKCIGARPVRVWYVTDVNLTVDRTVRVGVCCGWVDGEEEVGHVGYGTFHPPTDAPRRVA